MPIHDIDMSDVLDRELDRVRNELRATRAELDGADKVIANLKEELRLEKLRIDTLEGIIRDGSIVEIGYYQNGPQGFFIEVGQFEGWSHVGATLRDCLDAGIARVYHNPKGKC